MVETKDMKTKYPELNDYIQDCFFESSDMYEACKNIIEIISEYVKEPGINLQDIQAIIYNAEVKIEEIDLGL